jgi:hypothetical protein
MDAANLLIITLFNDPCSSMGYLGVVSNGKIDVKEQVRKRSWPFLMQ